MTCQGIPSGGESTGPALRIAVVCVCGCVSSLILKYGLEEVTRELGLQRVIVEVRDPGHLREGGYDALFCMSEIASRIATPFVSRVYAVVNAFDRQELRILLQDALAKRAVPIQQEE